MAKKHDIDQLADWARDWGLEGYEEYDPKWRDKMRTQALKRARQREERENRYTKERT